jgi:hypothetical protein
LSENSDDMRLDLIRTLLLDEEAIGEAAVFKVTVLQSTIDYETTKFEKQSDFQSAVVERLGLKKPFSPRHRILTMNSVVFEKAHD